MSSMYVVCIATAVLIVTKGLCVFSLKRDDPDVATPLVLLHHRVCLSLYVILKSRNGHHENYLPKVPLSAEISIRGRVHRKLSCHPPEDYSGLGALGGFTYGTGVASRLCHVHWDLGFDFGKRIICFSPKRCCDVATGVDYGVA